MESVKEAATRYTVIYSGGPAWEPSSEPGKSKALGFC